jgi:GNAT superfamily N-acetyltransferase
VEKEAREQMSAQGQELDSVTIENLQQQDLGEADHIFRVAFGTFIGLPDPASFHAGGDYVTTRWTSDPSAAFAAKMEGKLVGTNFATTWGSIGFFGPLTIHPDYWDRGVGQRLMQPITELFSQRNVKQAGLFTFAQSQKHVGLYQKFGFWPRFLTAVMSLPVKPTAEITELETFSERSGEARERSLDASFELTNQIFEGLDVRQEILAVTNQNLGDTVLLVENSRLIGLAVCHCGVGSEAGPEVCFVKFGAVRPTPSASETFERLISACEALAARRGLLRLVAGVNTARTEAYQQLIERGFKTQMQGVSMHRPNEPGYSRPGVFVLDDWR